ncbi:divergent polysaccharide deacetylase family protein [Loktanella sp. M215]|uniref:divergent polysaccharide deacetylase family protein n=1 Tax=Loktanella sp. M215 TaxID=2675431 RepID=UPI001F15956F|nr:divergent polysaccharide deacetylase family protein [Loktanella sp. M215]MCF7700065.1 hypothetical protein [Loktanella sp. M215]
MAFFKGAVWGVVVGGVGVVGASLIAPQPAGNTPPAAAQIAAPAAPESPSPEAGALESGAAELQAAAPTLPPAPAAETSADEPPAAPEPSPTMAPATAMPEPAAQTAAEQPDTAPAARPSADVSPKEPATPADTGLTQIAPAADAPVLPSLQSRAPQVPTAEADIVVQTAPPAPIAVTPPEADNPADATVTTETAAQVATVTGTPVTVLDNAPAPQGGETDLTIGDPLPETPLQDTAPLTVTTPEAEVALGGTVPPVAGSTAAPTATTEPSVTSVPPETPAPAPTDTVQKPAVVSIIDTPSSGLPGSGSTAIVRRDAPDVAEAAPEAPAPVVDDSTPALVRYGAFFANPEDLPLLSVVLYDDGTMANGARALSDVPFPVTVLLDPRSADAVEGMDAYAAAGIEVAALAAVPQGATDTDVEVAMEGTFDALPRAVALVDAGLGDMNAGREVTQRVIGDLAAAGRGLLVPDQGLNGALRAAAAADVPALTIYRDLDAEGQDARVIRRFIDQAAFRARQQQGVVLLARVRPETISALILWGDANRAGQVALAPLSATLLAQ